MVLGTDDTRTYITGGGGHLLELKPDESPEVVVVADEDWLLLRSVEAVLSALAGSSMPEIPKLMSQIRISSIPNEKANLVLVVLSHSCSKPDQSPLPGRNNQFIDLVSPTHLSSMRRGAFPRVSQ